MAQSFRFLLWNFILAILTFRHYSLGSILFALSLIKFNVVDYHETFVYNKDVFNDVGWYGICLSVA